MIRVQAAALSVLLILSMAWPAAAQQTAETGPKTPLSIVIPTDNTPARAIVPQGRQGSLRPSARLNSGMRGAFIGVFAGFAVGGLTGAAIDRQRYCGCDTPGFRGFMIGAPIGAVVGGVTGFLLATR